MLFEDVLHSASIFLADETKQLITVIALTIAIVTFYALTRKTTKVKTKILLIYLHLTALFFPLALFAYSTGCSAALTSCAGQSCASITAVLCGPNLIKLLVYPIPITIALTTITGFILLPLLHVSSSKTYALRDLRLKDFVKTWSRKLKMKTPKLYIVDEAKPFAYSFKAFNPSIFMSLGLLELFNYKEKEAVLLHEFYHLKENDSSYKFSTNLLKFSPLNLLKNFNKKHDLSEEERLADEFAEKIQKTHRHVNSAKKKINEYEKAQTKPVNAY